MIAHVDLDAFFVSVEQTHQVGLVGKPVAVGGTGRRGVISAASYEARKFKIHAAMPTWKALSLCTDLIVVEPRLDLYKQVSGKVFSLVEAVSGTVEQTGLDEAWIDVTLIADPLVWARDLKTLIKDKTGLVMSVGLGPSKLVSKIASGKSKPDGLLLVTDVNQQEFLDQVVIGDVPGVGAVKEKLLASVGVKYFADVRNVERDVLCGLLGEKEADGLVSWSLGQDNRKVTVRQPLTSISNEITLNFDAHSLKECEADLKTLTNKVCRRLQELNKTAQTITVKIRRSNFASVSRSVTLENPAASRTAVFTTVEFLAGKLDFSKGVRLVGITLSNLETREQKDLFVDLDSPKFQAGGQVHHQVFGKGEVVWEDPDENMVAVRFNDGKVRQLDSNHKSLSTIVGKTSLRGDSEL